MTKKLRKEVDPDAPSMRHLMIMVTVCIFGIIMFMVAIVGSAVE